MIEIQATRKEAVQIALKIPAEVNVNIDFLTELVYPQILIVNTNQGWILNEDNSQKAILVAEDDVVPQNYLPLHTVITRWKGKIGKRGVASWSNSKKIENLADARQFELNGRNYFVLERNANGLPTITITCPLAMAVLMPEIAGTLTVVI